MWNCNNEEMHFILRFLYKINVFDEINIFLNVKFFNKNFMIFKIKIYFRNIYFACIYFYFGASNNFGSGCFGV